MILSELKVSSTELERRTGWAIKPEGACKGDRCVPLPDHSDGDIDVQILSERLRMPLVADDKHGFWSLGPESDAPPLPSAEAPELTLPDWKSNDFSLSSLRGQKVLLLAWASW